MTKMHKRRIRAPSFVQAAEVAQKVGATSFVYEADGRKIEMRFVPDASDSANPWNAEIEKLSKQ